MGIFCEDHLDEPQAVIWYKRAAKHGYTLGDYYLGLYYKEGRGGLPLDLKQAEECFLRASKYVEAAYEYYECFRIRTHHDIENSEGSGQAILLLGKVLRAAMRRHNIHWEGYMNRSKTMKRPKST